MRTDNGFDAWPSNTNSIARADKIVNFELCAFGVGGDANMQGRITKEIVGEGSSRGEIELNDEK